MTQSEIDVAVARATGESVTTIRSLGFGLDPEPKLEHEDDQPRVLDWDEVDARRSVVFPLPTLARAA